MAILYPGMTIIATPFDIRINNQFYAWSSQDADIDPQPGSTVFIANHNRMVLEVKPGLSLIVLRHHIKSHDTGSVNFLGVYLGEDAALSDRSHGVIGQYIWTRKTMS